MRIFLLCAYVGEHAAKDERIELYGILEGLESPLKLVSVSAAPLHS